MRYIARLLAVAGLALAIVLFVREQPREIFGLLLSGGASLFLAALFHIVPMVLNGRAWQVLLRGSTAPHLGAMTYAVWVRESVNGLLPVGRIGGELVSYRLLRRFGVRRAPAAASLLVDMALSVLSQLCFALLGVVLLVAPAGPTEVGKQLVGGLLIMTALAVAFIFVQRVGTFGTITRLLDKLVAGRLQGAIGDSVRIDRSVNMMYRRTRTLIACFLWQCAGWLAGAGEIVIALYVLGYPVSVWEAIAIESSIQAISSAAFIVPGALSVQEGGFILVGAALGIDAPAAMALAAARRLRDVTILFPGLIAWQWFEARAGSLARRSEQRG